MRRHHILPALTKLILYSFDASTHPPLAPPSRSTSSPLMAKDTAVAPTSIDVSGVWQFHEDATFVLYDFSGDHSGSKAFKCHTDGTYTFVQTGDAFSGTFDQ